MLIITRIKVPPLPVSPHLLLLVMDGPDNVKYDRSFCAIVDEPMANDFARAVRGWDGTAASLDPSGSHGILGMRLIEAGVDVSTRQ